MSENYWTELDPPMSFIPEGWTYEKKRAFRYECIPYLLETVRFNEFARKRVLCVGDGSGIDAVEFARSGAKVSVFDMSMKAVLLTRQHFAEAGVNGPGVLEVGEQGDVVLGLPYVDACFDVVYSFGVIHHIPEVDKVVSEIARVLEPGGQFLGMVYHKDSLLYAYSILRRAEREGITADEAMRKYSERNEGCPYSMAYTRGELHALLRKQFKEVEIEAKYPVIDLPEKRKVSIGAPDSLGWHLFFRATK